jgi:hypothetical protein
MAMTLLSLIEVVLRVRSISELRQICDGTRRRSCDAFGGQAPDRVNGLRDRPGPVRVVDKSY